VADALSRLDLLPDLPNDSMGHPTNTTGVSASEAVPSTLQSDQNAQSEEVSLFEYMALQQDKLPDMVYPLRLSLISKEQMQDTALLNKLSSPGFTRKQIRGGGKLYDIIYYNNKIVVPTSL